MKNIIDLRNHLFDQLNRLAKAEGEAIDQEVVRAASIVQVSEAIIKSAEVENQLISITKEYGSGFIPAVSSSEGLPETAKLKQIPNVQF